MSYLYTPIRKSVFTLTIWFTWILSSLVGWSILFGSIIWIFYYFENIFVFPMFFIGSAIVGVVQWVNIRTIFSWSKLWIITSFIGIPLGFIYVVLLVTIIGPIGLGVGVIADSIFGVVGGIIATAVTVSISFIIITHYNGILIKRITKKINPEKLHIFEQIVIIKDAASTAIILNAIFFLLDVFVGIFIGGFTFAILTGFGANEIGVPMIGSKKEEVKSVA